MEDTIKNKITGDWNKAFPQMRIHKPLHLSKRIGPMLFGVILHNNTDSDFYMPMFYIHNLCKAAEEIEPDIYQTLIARNGESYIIPTLRHDWEFKEAAKYLKFQVMDNFMVTDFDDVTMFYYKQINYMEKTSNLHGPNLYEHIILLYIWAGKSESRTLALLHEFKQKMVKWSNESLERFGSEGLEGWVSKMSILIKNRNLVIQTVESEIIRHNLGNLIYEKLRV